MHSTDSDMDCAYAPTYKVSLKNHVTPPYLFSLTAIREEKTMNEKAVGGEAYYVIRHHTDHFTKQMLDI